MRTTAFAVALVLIAILVAWWWSSEDRRPDTRSDGAAASDVDDALAVPSPRARGEVPSPADAPSWRVHVEDANGRPLRGATVTVTSLADGAPAIPARVATDDAGDAAAPAASADARAWIEAEHSEFASTGLVANDVRGVHRVVLRAGTDLVGKVVTTDGRPVGGAHVVAEFAHGGAPAPVRTIDALTSPAGDFRLARCPPERTRRVRVEADGFVPADADEYPTPESAMRVVLHAATSLVLELSDEAGVPVEGAVALAERGGGSRLPVERWPYGVPEFVRLVPAGLGIYRTDSVAVGVQTLVVARGGFLPHRAVVKAQAGGTRVRITVARPARAATVQVRASGSNAAPLAGARVALLPGDTLEWEQQFTVAGLVEAGLVDAAPCDASGRTTVPSPGPHVDVVVAAAAPGHLDRFTRVAISEAGELEPVELYPLPAPWTGRVVDAVTGSALRSAAVTVGRHVAWTDAEGRFSLDAKGLEAPLRVTAPGRCELLMLAPDDGGDLGDLALPEGQILRCVLRDAARGPVPGVPVNVVAEGTAVLFGDAEMPWIRSMLSDGDGVVEVRVPPCRRVQVVVDSRTWRGSTELDYAEPTPTAELVLESLVPTRLAGRLVGTPPSLAERLVVRVRSGDDSRHAAPDHEGRFRIDGVPRGRLTVEAVVLPAGGDDEFAAGAVEVAGGPDAKGFVEIDVSHLADRVLTVRAPSSVDADDDLAGWATPPDGTSIRMHRARRGEIAALAAAAASETWVCLSFDPRRSLAGTSECVPGRDAAVELVRCGFVVVARGEVQVRDVRGRTVLRGSSSLLVRTGDNWAAPLPPGRYEVTSGDSPAAVVDVVAGGTIEIR